MQNKENTIQERYNDFITRIDKMSSSFRVSSYNDKQKEQYEEIYKELIDTRVRNVEGLTQEETEYVRRRLGIGSSILGIGEIGTLYSSTIKEVNEVLTSATAKILIRIKRGYAKLEEKISNEQMTQAELLKCPIESMDGVDIKTVRILNSKGFIYLKDLAKHSISEIQQVCRSIETPDIIKFSECIKKSGLSISETVNYKLLKSCSKRIKEYQLELKKKECEEINEAERGYDKQIKELLELKKTCILRKAELLGEINDLENEISPKKPKSL